MSRKAEDGNNKEGINSQKSRRPQNRAKTFDRRVAIKLAREENLICKVEGRVQLEGLAEDDQTHFEGCFCAESEIEKKMVFFSFCCKMLSYNKMRLFSRSLLLKNPKTTHAQLYEHAL